MDTTYSPNASSSPSSSDGGDWLDPPLSWLPTIYLEIHPKGGQDVEK